MSEENKNIPEPEEKETEDLKPCVSKSDDEPEMEQEGKIKRERHVSLVTVICTCVAVALAAVMLTYSLCSVFYELKIRRLKEDMTGTQQGDPNVTAQLTELELLERLFEQYSFCDLNEEELKTAVLRAYVEATGDKYARYYTDEEYAELMEDLGGDTEGIGINTIDTVVTVGGIEYKALKVVNVMQGAPAQTAGLQRGDYIVAVGTLAEYTTVNVMGYDAALAALKGSAGTKAEFLVYRFDGADYTLIPFSIMRAVFEADYVMTEAIIDPATSEKIGLIHISRFYYDTPKQVCEAVDRLKAEGCTKFVFDLRNNPGGLVMSLVATLSYFLDEGDTVMSVIDKQGHGEVTTVAPINKHTGEAAGCNVRAEDIGKYKDINAVVLCNENTASAAELFVANFRDHGIGKVVGMKTYGKGSVQTYVPLYPYGYSGYIKMTIKMYYPPNGVGYDGVGIAPDIEIQLSDEAMSKNQYDIFGDLSIDNQLAEAIKHFK